MSEENAVDYGPLAALIGTWEGGEGMDVSPEPDGEECDPYFETLMFEAIGDVTNAGEQTLGVLRYHQVVSRKSDGEVFHNETGYWSWDGATKTLSHSLTIPRGMAVLAGGTWQGRAGDERTIIEVEASLDHPNWTIVQSPFLAEKAKTTGFKHTITVEGDRLEYSETTVLEIYGKRFDHTDGNVLKRQ